MRRLRSAIPDADVLFYYNEYKDGRVSIGAVESVLGLGRQAIRDRWKDLGLEPPRFKATGDVWRNGYAEHDHVTLDGVCLICDVRVGL